MALFFVHARHTTKMSRKLPLCALCFLGAILTTRSDQAQTSGSGAAGTVTPELICVDYNAEKGLLSAYLTARNTFASDQQIPIGAQNYFAPGFPNQGQPNYFPVGESEQFVLSFYLSDFPHFDWVLAGHTLRISSQGPPCRLNNFLPAKDLNLPGPGSYAKQYLGAYRQGPINATVSVVPNLAGVTVSNVQISATSLDGSIGDPTTQYIYGDVTVLAGAPTSTKLLIGITGGTVQSAFGFDTVLAGASSPDSTGCPTNVTSSLSPRAGAATQLLGTNIYTQLVMVQNTSGTAIAGPIQLALTQLSSNATAFNANGTGTCPGYQGAPYVTITGGLAANAYGAVVVTFTNSGVPTNAITYTPVLLSGGSRL